MIDDGFNTPDNIQSQIRWLESLAAERHRLHVERAFSARCAESQCSQRGHKPSPLTAECDCGAVAYEVTE